MPTKLKRMTFVITPEIDEMLNTAKKEVYYDCTRSEMVRDLLVAGLEAKNVEGKKNAGK